MVHAIAVSLFLLFLFASASRSVGETKYNTKPHIIFIFADDLGWGDVSFLGSPQSPTPNMDALASTGVLLKNYYFTTLCSPSRGALMSGRYSIHIDGTRKVAKKAIEETLVSFRHHMCIFSYTYYWHIGYSSLKYTPTYRGFDSFLGFYTGPIDYYSHFMNSVVLHVLQSGSNGLDFWKNPTPLTTANGDISVGRGSVSDNSAIIHCSQAEVELSALYHALYGDPGTHTGGDVKDLGSLDGFDMWEALNVGKPSPRTEILLNIDLAKGNAPLRYRGFKLLVGNLTNANQRYERIGGSRPCEDLDVLLRRSRAAAVLRRIYKRDVFENMGCWRREATVKCLGVSNWNFVSGRSYYLYDIAKDPCELHDISEQRPQLVDMLLQKLAFTRKPPRHL